MPDAVMAARRHGGPHRSKEPGSLHAGDDAAGPAKEDDVDGGGGESGAGPLLEVCGSPPAQPRLDGGFHVVAGT
ncbi:hypothetical protein GCM10014715_66540 [Streptomyces spiralis]|uniref:Uncharacterized protein n=1 Tax=Streptomyces spiralis TaxID=66376 RepID=A0A919AEL2_9ACTN|nr:hypothetical protein GCM10014715_66540 [Streptomyces spiralis]